jgi:hypothetical protein
MLATSQRPSSSGGEKKIGGTHAVIGTMYIKEGESPSAELFESELLDALQDVTA